jgi:hypothetical protein
MNEYRVWPVGKYWNEADDGFSFRTECVEDAVRKWAHRRLNEMGHIDPRWVYVRDEAGVRTEWTVSMRVEFDVAAQTGSSTDGK